MKPLLSRGFTRFQTRNFGLGLPLLEEMAEEHEAWVEVCHRLERTLSSYMTTITGSDPTLDDPRWQPVLSQIKYWGETLHQLRLAGPKHDANAYAEAKEVAQECGERSQPPSRGR